MNYRSISDLAALIRGSIHKIPEDIDLIVGVPRSGMLAATIIALNLNNQLTPLNSFTANTPLLSGGTRLSRNKHLLYPQNAGHVLLVDDSVSTGTSISKALKQVKDCGFQGRITTCAAYALPGDTKVNVSFEELAHTRIFEWNVMHREYLRYCCVDLDGVLCLDPTESENDDGANYRNFLQNTSALSIPTYEIGRIVTSRLEKYRNDTVTWLSAHGIRYRSLDMLDLPDAATRRRMKAHATHKAAIFKNDPTMSLFIESNREQAIEISKLSGKPALCFETQELFPPGFSIPYLRQTSRGALRRIVALLKKNTFPRRVKS